MTTAALAAVPVLLVALWVAAWDYRVQMRKLRRFVARPVRTDEEILWGNRAVRYAAYQDALRLASGLDPRAHAAAMAAMTRVED